MITVAILINGQPIYARTAVNTKRSLRDGRTIYSLDDGQEVYHHREERAVKLAIKMLRKIKEPKSE